jgi:hypothetical protein
MQRPYLHDKNSLLDRDMSYRSSADGDGVSGELGIPLLFGLLARNAYVDVNAPVGALETVTGASMGLVRDKSSIRCACP